MRASQSESSRSRKPARESQPSGHARKGQAPHNRPRAKSRARQCELAFRPWGGARMGAGAKPKGERPLVAHDKRPAHKASCPVLITTRVSPGLPSLRRPGEAGSIRAAFSQSNESARIRVVHHSIQSNHLHLIVEATDRRALTRGVQGLLVRIARALNRFWNRCGRVFGDRFHERELRNPRQVRNALVYVLQNLRKHGISMQGPDPFSSGPAFDGWLTCVVRAPGPERRSPSRAGGGASWSVPMAMSKAERGAAVEPKTWLLDVGWRRHGLIDLGEGPVPR